jgi:GGDEF domain-containing protein
VARNEKKKRNLTFNFLNRFMIIQFVLMLGLSLFITKKVSDTTKENATAQLSAIANERARTVVEYMEDAESKLRLFAADAKTVELLNNQNDEQAAIDAQKCTDTFAAEIPGLEGLYIADWKSKVLTHNARSAVGTILRMGDDLTELQEQINAASPEVYSAGIIVSPVTGKKVLSIYRGVIGQNGKPAGFVGMALDADYAMEKLADIKAPGLEHSTYTMMDVVKAEYVFDQDDPNNAGVPVSLPDLVRTCEEYSQGINTDISTTYEYSLPGVGSFVGASVWVADRNWILMMNDQSAEVYNVAYAMRMFLGFFCALILALMILFAFLNKKQEKVNLKLVASVERANQAKNSLNSVMFNDVLTEAGNRVKLTLALSDIVDSKTNPYYFAMFNLMEFSGINTAFGSDTGDDMLVRTANELKESFPDGSVYRTGSDEFVVMMRTEGGNPRTDVMLADVDNVLKKLITPQNIEGVGMLYPKYKVAVIKKNTDIDASIITILKEMTNARGEAIVGRIDFSDLSE